MSDYDVWNMPTSELRSKLAAEKARADKAEAACAEMRAYLSDFGPEGSVRVKQLLSTDCGKDFVHKSQVGCTPEVAGKVREGLEHWVKFYEAQLADADGLAAELEKQGDMYGWNFHKGRRAGLVEHDIGLHKLKEALALLNAK